MNILQEIKMKYAFRGGNLAVVKDERILTRRADLASYAIAKDWVVLCGNQEIIDSYKVINHWVAVVGYAPNFTRHIGNIEAESGVLIDESVLPEMVEHLRDNYPQITIRGGYTYES